MRDGVVLALAAERDAALEHVRGRAAALALLLAAGVERGDGALPERDRERRARVAAKEAVRERVRVAVVGRRGPQRLRERARDAARAEPRALALERVRHRRVEHDLLRAVDAPRSPRGARRVRKLLPHVLERARAQRPQLRALAHLPPTVTPVSVHLISFSLSLFLLLCSETLLLFEESVSRSLRGKGKGEGEKKKTPHFTTRFNKRNTRDVVVMMMVTTETTEVKQQQKGQGQGEEGERWRRRVRRSDRGAGRGPC